MPSGVGYAFTWCRYASADSFCNSGRPVRGSGDGAASARNEGGDRPGVEAGVDRVVEVLGCGSALAAAGFERGEDPFDPAVAALGLGAAGDPAQDDRAAHRALRVIVCLGDAGHLAERPERGVFLKQSGAEAGGLGVAAARALLKQRAEPLAQRRELLTQRDQRRVLGTVSAGERRGVLAVDREHLAGDVEQSGAELAGRAGTLGQVGQLAHGVGPTELLLQNVEPVVADVAVAGDEPAEVLAQ